MHLELISAFLLPQLACLSTRLLVAVYSYYNISACCHNLRFWYIKPIVIVSKHYNLVICFLYHMSYMVCIVCPHTFIEQRLRVLPFVGRQINVLSPCPRVFGCFSCW